jgi:hypothetical protein
LGIRCGWLESLVMANGVPGRSSSNPIKIPGFILLAGQSVCQQTRRDESSQNGTTT